MVNSSQHQIENYVSNYFKTGKFLEIGCWDGELISQTSVLEQQGWSGVCVDPFPKHFSKRKCKLIKKAVSKDGFDREFIRVSIDRRYGGDVSYFSGFKDAVKAHLPLIEDYCDYQNIIVQTITIDEIYSQTELPLYVEFLSVDTEGSELEIFQSIDFNKYKFGLIVFEHNEEEDTKSGVGKILTENGYRLIESLRCDDIYISNEL
jgi:FkbM family methyltransferase